MPETDETREAGRPAAPYRKRVRRHRRRPLLVRYWWLIPVAGLVVVAPLFWGWAFSAHRIHAPLPGYIVDTGKIEEEYSTFTGKALDPAAVRQFDRATGLMREGNYANATLVLETAAKTIPVPAVFNDLGLLYWKLKDRAHALQAFRDALARDHDYAPVRASLKTIHEPTPIDPGAEELEPNDDKSQANVVWLDRPLQAAITPSVGDVDFFWFITPRPPRDRISLGVISRSAALIPRLRIFDENGGLITGLKEAPGPGAALRYDFSPPPNTLYYVQVDGASSSSGAYTLTVNALHAYDVHEPNDTIFTATRITLGQTVDANIMDSDDTDFYSFQSPVAASVSIDVVSHSGTLALGLGTFAPDLHNIGFVPDPKAPGDPIHHTMHVEANQVYYLQVFSKSDTTGPYGLVVK